MRLRPSTCHRAKQKHPNAQPGLFFGHSMQMISDLGGQRYQFSSQWMHFRHGGYEGRTVEVSIKIMLRELFSEVSRPKSGPATSRLGC